MKRARTAILSSVSAVVMIACSSAVIESNGGPADEDAGATPPPPPPADAGPVPEASSRVDAGPPERLELACEVDPCYRAISGNGGKHYCGLIDDGTVRCWGRDAQDPLAAVGDGALGRGDLTSAIDGATPAPVIGLEDVTQISVGPNYGSCARTQSGSVYCWGRNDFGQLGRPRGEARLPLPTLVEGLPPVDHVELGFRTACAIGSADKALYCWGDSTMIDLGADAGGTNTFAPQPITIFPPPIKALAIGTWTNRDTVITLLEGDILSNIGEAPTGESSVDGGGPLDVPHVTGIGTFAYLTNGLLERWRPRPGTLYLPSSREVVQVAIAGANGQGGALLADGRLFRWGTNAGGALAQSPYTLAAAQHPLEMPVSKVVSFATTDKSTCASLQNGEVMCWGSNFYGELGRGTLDSDAHPEPEVTR